MRFTMNHPPLQLSTLPSLRKTTRVIYPKSLNILDSHVITSIILLE